MQVKGDSSSSTGKIMEIKEAYIASFLTNILIFQPSYYLLAMVLLIEDVFTEND